MATWFFSLGDLAISCSLLLKVSANASLTTRLIHAEDCATRWRWQLAQCLPTLLKVLRDTRQAMIFEIEGKKYKLELNSNSTLAEFANKVVSSKNTFITIDTFLYSMIVRIMKLNEGFMTLLEMKNEICAMPLIRIQLDNLNYLYAGIHVDDYDYFFHRLLKGKPINQMKDMNGNPLTSRYITERIDEKFPMIKQIRMSGDKFVHPSEAMTKSVFKVTLDESTGMPVTFKRSGYNEDFYSDVQRYQMFMSMACVNEAVVYYLELFMKWREDNEQLVSSASVNNVVHHVAVFCLVVELDIYSVIHSSASRESVRELNVIPHCASAALVVRCLVLA